MSFPVKFTPLAPPRGNDARAVADWAYARFREIGLILGGPIRPIELVDSLPPQGEEVGQIIFNLGDGVQYQWDGTAWVPIIAGLIETSQLADFIVTEQKLKLTTHFIDRTNLVVLDNTPQIGHISWSGLRIVYKGVEYQIQDGSTNKRYAYWAPTASTTALQTSDGLPVLGEDDLIVFVNANGAHLTVPTTTVMHGSLLVEESVTANAIAANTITGDKIAANTILGTHIQAGQITAAHIAVAQLSALSANLGEVTAGRLRSLDQRFDADLNNQLITIKDAQSTPQTRVRLGKLGTGAQDYGIEIYSASGGLVLGANGLGLNVVGADQIQSGAITTAKFASGIRPVEIVASLPQTGTVGQVVLLTTDHKLYRWDGSQWTAAVPAVDITGQIVASQIADAAINTAKFAAGIRPVEIVSSLPAPGTAGRVVFLTTDNKLYRDTGTAWTAAVPAADLTGQITTTQIADGAVTTTKLGDASVTTTKIADGQITTAKIVDAAVTTTKLGDGAVTEAKIGNSAVTVTKLADGTVTQVKMASGLRVPEIVSSLPAPGTQGRLVFLTTDNKLYRDTGTAWTAAVPTADLTGQITTTQIADGAITTTKLGDASVTTTKIADGQITTAKIVDAAVTTTKLGDGAVTEAKIGNSAVTVTKLADGTVTQVKMASGLRVPEIVSSLPAPGTQGRLVFLTTDNKLYRDTGTAWTAAVPTADLTGQITTTQIADGAISTPKLAAGAVTAAKIAAGTITGDKIAANTITAGNIAAGAIGADEIAAGAVVAGKIAAGAVSTAELAAGAVTAAKIAAGTITVDKIAIFGATRADELYVRGTGLNNSGNRQVRLGSTFLVNGGGRGLALTVLKRSDHSHLSYSRDGTATGTVAASQIYDIHGSDADRLSLRDALVELRTNANGTRAAGEWGDDIIIIITSFDSWITAAANGDALVDELLNHGASEAVRGIGTPRIPYLLIGIPGIGEGRGIEVMTNNGTVDPWAEYAGLLLNGNLAGLGGLLPSSVSATIIKDGAISTPKLAAGAVTTDKLAAGAVTADKIAANTITAGNIATGAIGADEIAAGAVVAGKIAAGAVSTAELAAGAVTAAKIAANAIQSSHIAAGQITASHLAADSVTAGAIAAGAVSTSELAAGAVTTAKLAAGAVTANELAANAVTAAKIQANAIQSSHIAAGQITAAHLAADSVTAGAIAAGAVSTAELAAGAVTTDKLAAGAVTAAKIAAGTITGDKIAANTITAGNIATGAIGADEIAAGAVTADKIAAGAVTAGKIAAGAVDATNISVSQLSAISANLGEVTAGRLRSPDQKFDVDLSGQLVTIKDAQSTPKTRVRLGKLGTGAQDYGIEIYSASGNEMIRADGNAGRHFQQFDGVTPRPLLRGHLSGQAKHGEQVTFPQNFQTVPMVLIYGGISYEPRSAKWSNGLDTAKPQYDDMAAEDLTAAGFTVRARLRQKGIVSQITHNFPANNNLATVGATVEVTLSSAPSSNNKYRVHYRVNMSHGLIGETGTSTLTVAVDSGVFDGVSTTWTERVTRNYSITGETAQTWSHEQPVITVSQLDNNDRIRLRIVSLDTTAGAVSFSVHGFDGSGDPSPGVGVDYTVSTDSFASKTPDADDFVTWEAIEVAL